MILTEQNMPLRSCFLILEWYNHRRGDYLNII